jgi:hypothetical protein
MPRYTIKDGPSKWDLSVSLFEGNPSARHLVTFQLLHAPEREISVAMVQVGQEDGSGESWVFEGHTRGSNSSNVSGYYSSRNREGYIDIF